MNKNPFYVTHMLTYICTYLPCYVAWVHHHTHTCTWKYRTQQQYSSSFPLVAHFSHWYRNIHTRWSIKRQACCCLVIDALVHTHTSHTRLARARAPPTCSGYRIWECTNTVGTVSLGLNAWAHVSSQTLHDARFCADITYSTRGVSVICLHSDWT